MSFVPWTKVNVMRPKNESFSTFSQLQISIHHGPPELTMGNGGFREGHIARMIHTGPSGHKHEPEMMVGIVTAHHALIQDDLLLMLPIEHGRHSKMGTDDVTTLQIAHQVEAGMTL